MKNAVCILVVLLAVMVCVLVVTLRSVGGKATPLAGDERASLEESIATLERQIRTVESERDLAHRRVRELQRQLTELDQQRHEDQQVIRDLWAMAMAATRRRSLRSPKVEQVVASGQEDANAVDPQAEARAKYDGASVKEMLAASGGDFQSAVNRIITKDGIDAILQAHAEEPAYWVATASLMPDREAALAFLEEAARLHADSPAVLSALAEAQVLAGQVDEATLALADGLERIDPTNLLADCLAAYSQFENGDVGGALQALSEAAAKARFADDRIDMLMARYDCFLAEGCADSVALGLAAFTMPMGHMGMLRQVGQQSVEQVQSLSAAGQYEQALRIAQNVSSVGRTVASSGRFLVQDRVGMALQEAGLLQQRQIYEALGDTPGIQAVDLQLQALGERSAMIDTMVQGFGPVMAAMSEDDLAAYVESTILKGEFATLQEIPEIAEALNQPVPPEQEETGKTAVP